MHEVLRLYSLIHDCAELGAVQVLVIWQSKACWNNRARMYYGRIWLYGCPEMRVTHVYVFWASSLNCSFGDQMLWYACNLLPKSCLDLSFLFLILLMYFFLTIAMIVILIVITISQLVCEVNSFLWGTGEEGSSLLSLLSMYFLQCFVHFKSLCDRGCKGHITYSFQTWSLFVMLSDITLFACRFDSSPRGFEESIS